MEKRGVEFDRLRACSVAFYLHNDSHISWTIIEKVEKNKKELEGYVSQILSPTSNRNFLHVENNGHGKMLSSRIVSPLCKYTGDKDYISGHEVISLISTRLPFVEKLPPYTTWIFLDRNQRMAEDQSVVGRRRIYYDPHGSEALLCSDSEEEVIAEPEEEKHEFVEGEDRILRAVSEEYGLTEEVLSTLGNFLGIRTSELEERNNLLKEKYSALNLEGSGDSSSGCGICLDKSLTAALDSFDNLFCRRCLLFDCRLHGCSQPLINPSEKQPYWSEYEDDREPCGDTCYLRFRASKNTSQGSNTWNIDGVKDKNSEENKLIVASLKDEEPTTKDGNHITHENEITEKETTAAPEGLCSLETAPGAQNLDQPFKAGEGSEHPGKRKALEENNKVILDLTHSSDDLQDSTSKKQRTILVLDACTLANETVQGQSCSSVARSPCKNNDAPVLDVHINWKACENEPDISWPENPSFPPNAACKDTENSMGKESMSGGQMPEFKQFAFEWKPIERELYLKGVEIFGRNSCLIARNLLSGLKTCSEVSAYMFDNGASTLHRSVMPNSLLEENQKLDTNFMEQEMSTRPRLLRRKGRTRKLKYSWKSAGHPSMWKRIADGKNQSCKQYTPCGCQSMCGKQCPCLHNGTCCEKYCGCSKSCKNRFRGCHCAKSQCRSRQCPCFAAGRECDPDVCRNCWVSCGGGSFGEPPKRGDGQCGNMRLLLRQQQRILLAKSDVAGWGAFLKNSVNKNDYLGEYTGELISHREADKRGKIYDRANSSFLFDLNDQYVLDAYRKGDKLKFANHSSNPNCYAKVMLVAGDHRVGIFAKEHIEASEELFYDYRYGPDQAPAWARKPEGSKRDDSSVAQGRAKKHQSH